jgi:hypothetical protein
MEENMKLATEFAIDAATAISRLEHVAETLEKLGSTAQWMIDMKPDGVTEEEFQNAQKLADAFKKAGKLAGEAYACFDGLLED